MLIKLALIFLSVFKKVHYIARYLLPIIATKLKNHGALKIRIHLA